MGVPGVPFAPENAPSSTSARKHREADELEMEVTNKVKLASTLDGAAKRAAEKEIEALGERLEGLRVEADEAYARELAGQQ